MEAECVVSKPETGLLELVNFEESQHIPAMRFPTLRVSFALFAQPTIVFPFAVLYLVRIAALLGESVQLLQEIYSSKGSD